MSADQYPGKTGGDFSINRLARLKSLYRVDSLHGPCYGEKLSSLIRILAGVVRSVAKIAKESCGAIIKALNEDGIIGPTQLKIHFDLIRKAEKGIGEIPVDKVADFRLLKEVRRELSGK